MGIALVQSTISRAQAIKTSYVTFSGTVKDANGDFVRRRVFLIEYLRERVIDTTFSDATTGEYSLSAVGGANDVFSVLVIGENGENDKVKGGLQGDFT